MTYLINRIQVFSAKGTYIFIMNLNYLSYKWNGEFFIFVFVGRNQFIFPISKCQSPWIIHVFTHFGHIQNYTKAATKTKQKTTITIMEWKEMHWQTTYDVLIIHRKTFSRKWTTLKLWKPWKSIWTFVCYI